MTDKLALAPGHFYKSRAGDVWCCYRVYSHRPPHCQARCVKVSGGQVEYFFADGRYDSKGDREHTLVSECGPEGGDLTAPLEDKVREYERVLNEIACWGDDGPPAARDEPSSSERARQVLRRFSADRKESS